MRHSVPLIIISLFVTGLTSCGKDYAADDVVSPQIETGSRTGGTDESADSVRLLVRNKLSGYEIIGLSINGVQHDDTIMPHSNSAFQINSEERIRTVDINCSIHCVDGSNEIIGNLHGTKDITGHGTEETIDIDAAFLGLGAITFDAGVSGHEKDSVVLF